MQIVSAYLIAAAVSKGFSGNLFTENELNLSNWEHDAKVSNVYQYSVNTTTVEIQQNKAPNGIVYQYKYHWRMKQGNQGVYEMDLYCNKKIGFMNRDGFCLNSDNLITTRRITLNCPNAGIYTNSSNFRFYDSDNTWVTPDHCIYSYGNSGGGRVFVPTTDPDYLVIDSDIPYFSSTSDLYDYLIDGSASVFPSAGQYMRITKPVVSGNLYEFSFRGCTPSGFEYQSGASLEDITVVSGANSVFVQWDNVASETRQPYLLRFTAGANTATIAFHFSEMANDQDFNFKISNLELVEVTS